MKRFTLSKCIATVGLALLASSSQASDYSFQIDHFLVFKNVDPVALETSSGLLGITPLFMDGFDNGYVPGDVNDVHTFSNGTTATYSLVGSVGPETGSKLSLSHSGMVDNGFGTLRTNVNLNTDTTTDPTKGLKEENSNFAVVGVWDLTNPGNSNGSYGVRFNDSFAGVFGNDIISLSVQGHIDGQAVVSFLRFNNVDGTSSLLERHVLDTGHQQIALGLAYFDTDNNGSKEIGAGYFYIDGATVSDLYTMNATTQIFHDETWTRAAFFAADSAPVPEPAEYLMMLAGLGLIGFVVRRHQKV